AFAAFLGLALENSPLPPGEGQGVRETYPRPYRTRDEMTRVRSTGFSRKSAARPPEGGTTNGAFPTACGLSAPKGSAIQPSGEGQGVRETFRWQAVAVGDTCLLHTRDNVLVRAFPLERAEQFDNFPKL